MAKKVAGTPKQPKPAKKVRVNLGDGGLDFTGRVNVQKGLRITIPKSPKVTPVILSNLTTWSTDTDAAAAIYANIGVLEAQLEQEYGALDVAAGTMNKDRGTMLVALEAVCLTEDDAKGFGAGTAAAPKHVDASAPTVIRQILTNTPGDNRFRWNSQAGAVSYSAQVRLVVTPPPATPASFAEYYVGRSPFFNLIGTAGQTYAIQVRAVGKAASPWSQTFTVTLR